MGYSSYWELINSMEEAVKDYVEYAGGIEELEPSDAAHEIADSLTPIYTSDLMRLAADNINLAVDEPELGPAFDGRPTPVNIVAANIYEALHSEASQLLYEMEGD